MFLLACISPKILLFAKPAAYPSLCPCLTAVPQSTTSVEYLVVGQQRVLQKGMDLHSSALCKFTVKKKVVMLWFQLLPWHKFIVMIQAVSVLTHPICV